MTEWGSKDGWPVVILHGGSHDASHWAEVCRRLPSSLRCVVPDQRGHGRSERAPDGDYSCQAQVSDLVALVDALAIQRFALVGHSMGGLNALHVAGTWPERVRALVLVDVGTETRESGLAAIARSRRRAAAAPPPAPPVSAASFDLRLLDFVPTYGGDAGERRRLLEASRAPLLVMRGEKSKINSAQSAGRTAQIGRGRVVTIPNAGHNVSLHSPEHVADEFWQFLGPLAASE
ncbi:MAG: alpha/beta hydrolase [bacterium]|nr:alpha/beta hydrolase [bacterium]MCP5066473.1 alpha/beta hydrolase [bacterium]